VDAGKGRALLKEQLICSLLGVVSDLSICLISFRVKIIAHLQDLLGGEEAIAREGNDSPVAESAIEGVHVVLDPPLACEVDSDGGSGGGSLFRLFLGLGIGHWDFIFNILF
jgi:hypothetical protein